MITPQQALDALFQSARMEEKIIEAEESVD
jgi:hypothetical protein